MKYSFSIVMFSILWMESLFCQSPAKSSYVSERSNFSIGLTGGYNSICGNFSLYLGYRFFKLVEINLNGGANRLEGAGFSAGFRITPIKDKRWSPHIGFNYNSHKPGGFETGSGPDASYYRNTSNSNILYQLGAIRDDDFVSFLLSVNYKQVLVPSTLILVSGLPDATLESRAVSVYKNGLGLTVGLIFHPFQRNNKGVKSQAQF